MKDLKSGKIDIFCHIMPHRYKEALYRKVERGLHPGARDNLQAFHNANPALFDLELRLRVMDRYEGLRQVLTMALPPVEAIAGPDEAAELAKLANDEMAGLVAKYPRQFVAGVACLPMNNIDAALHEAERAIEQLKLKGVLVYTPSNGKPLDSPEYMPLYKMMAEYGLPIWIHPIRGRDTPDYRGESYSKYMIYHIFGWPYETTAAMVRLVFSGVLDKYPSLKFITHHCGAMVPYFAQRLGNTGQGIVEGQGDTETRVSLSRPPLEYFKMFYADTALTGDTAGLMCGYAFFGAEHMLLGTDMPFGGTDKVATTISSVEQMAIPDSDKYKIFEGNAKRLLGL